MNLAAVNALFDREFKRDGLDALGYPAFRFPPITPPKAIEPLVLPVNQENEE